MSSKSALRAALTDFVRRKAGGISILVCKVTSVDPDKKTCVCTPVNGDAVIPAVRLIQTPDLKGLLILPKRDSFVAVSYLSDGSAYVAMFSEIDDVMLDVEKTITMTAKEPMTLETEKSLVIKGPDLITLNGDDYHGVPKADALAKKLNALEDKINKLDLAISAIIAASGVAGPVLNSVLAGYFTTTAMYDPSPIVPTTSIELQNTKVKHGSGT